MRRQLFVAETDEIGQVVCVWWVSRDSDRPRPYSRAKGDEIDFTVADFSGSDHQAIRRWIEAHATG